MMNLLRLLQPLPYPTPAKLYNIWNVAHRNEVDYQIIELQIFPLVAGDTSKNKPKFNIRATSFEEYKCGDPSATRLTILHTRFTSEMIAYIPRLVQQCSRYPRPDLLFDLKGTWYNMCHKSAHLCYYLANVKKMAAVRQADIPSETALTQKRIDQRALLRLIPTLWENGPRSVLYLGASGPVPSGVHGSYLVMPRDTIDTPIGFERWLGHPSNAYAMGHAMTWLYIMVGTGTEEDTCVALTGEGCSTKFMVDMKIAEAKMSKKKRKKGGPSERWDTAYWQSCKTTTCGKTTPANAVDPEQLQPEGWVPVARVPVWLVEISAQTRITCKVVGLFIIIAHASWGYSKVSTHAHMKGMGTLRFLASVHIVAGHMQNKGKDVMTPVLYAEFGYTWVPWFMMLSGFMLSWSAATASAKITPQGNFSTLPQFSCLGSWALFSPITHHSTTTHHSPVLNNSRLHLSPFQMPPPPLPS
jgi:hypothetical protein